MTLAANNALLSVDELKAFLASGATMTAEDSALQVVINRASDMIQARLGRRLIDSVTESVRDPYTEYHSPWRPTSELYLGDWPIDTVTSVHEDTNREYGAGTLLVSGTDYIVSKPAGKLIRIESATGGRCSWEMGFRTVKVVFTPLWTLAASLPDRFRDAALHLSAILWREQDQQRQGVSGQSDGMGNRTFVTVSHMPRYIAELLDAERAPNFGTTWERDA